MSSKEKEILSRIEDQLKLVCGQSLRAQASYTDKNVMYMTFAYEQQTATLPDIFALEEAGITVTSSKVSREWTKNTGELQIPFRGIIYARYVLSDEELLTINAAKEGISIRDGLEDVYEDASYALTEMGRKLETIKYLVQSKQNLDRISKMCEDVNAFNESLKSFMTDLKG